MLLNTSEQYGTLDLTTGGIREFRPGRTPFDETVRVVCHECNNGWMNRVDQDAEPAVLALFNGTPFLFTADNSRQVASWACKVTLMRAHQNAEIGIAAEDFHWLFEHRVPPPNWVVFLGQTDRVGLIDECRYIVEERPPGGRQNRAAEASHRLISADSCWFLMQ